MGCVFFFDFVTFTKSDGYKEGCKRASFALQKGVFYNAKGHLLQCKMIYKIQLIGNKQVTLFVKLNR